MSQNVDKDQIFEFLRVASLDTNYEAMRDAYWMIMYIFLKKSLSIDISDSLLHMGKVRHMLKDVDLSQFSFKNGFLLRVSPFYGIFSGCRR
jgi:hypothetical protein